MARAAKPKQASNRDPQASANCAAIPRVGQTIQARTTAPIGRLRNARSSSLFDIETPVIKGSVTVLTGDCRERLKELKPGSIQTCVTSPPYWGLRDYDHSHQIGTEPSPTEYVQQLVAVFSEVRRVLRDDGVLWLNIGDGYARNGGTGRHGPNAIVGNTKKMIQRRNCRVPECWGLKDKDLFGLPWRVAFALQEAGWYLRSHITWIKRTAMPESVRDRPSNATEDVFLLTKSARYYYDQYGVREESGANLRNYWRLGPDPSGHGHPAAFPRELARRCILLASRQGDTVLDPFGGSGTTGIAAVEAGRRAVLIELNPEYSKISEERVGNGPTSRIQVANS